MNFAPQALYTFPDKQKHNITTSKRCEYCSQKNEQLIPKIHLIPLVKTYYIECLSTLHLSLSSPICEYLLLHSYSPLFHRKRTVLTMPNKVCAIIKNILKDNVTINISVYVTAKCVVFMQNFVLSTETGCFCPGMRHYSSCGRGRGACVK